eukprot:scaffold508831_cov22-Prasinocladus_malaysianus.AAC.1
MTALGAHMKNSRVPHTQARTRICREAKQSDVQNPLGVVAISCAAPWPRTGTRTRSEIPACVPVPALEKLNPTSYHY